MVPRLAHFVPFRGKGAAAWKFMGTKIPEVGVPVEWRTRTSGRLKS
jgi:hypothetical protein